MKNRDFSLFRDCIQSWKSSNAYKGYVLLLILAWLKQLAYPATLTDSREYLQAAHNLTANGTWSVCDFAHSECEIWLPQTRRTVGYPLWLLLTQWMWLTCLLQTILALFVPVITLRILRKAKLLFSEKLLFLLFLSFPLLFYYSPMVMPEIAVLVCILFLFSACQNRQWISAILFLCCLVLLKPVFMPLAWLALAGVVLLPGWKKTTALLPAGLVFAFSFINEKNTDVFHYSSIPVVNAYEYNIRPLLSDAEQFYKSGDSAMLNRTFAEKYSYMRSQTTEVLKRNMWQYLWLHLRGGLLALIDPGRYDFVAFFQLPQAEGLMGIKEGGGLGALVRQPRYYLFYIMVFTLFAAIRLIMAVLALLRGPARVWWLALPVVYIVVLTGPVGSARYILPVIPFIIALAAAGVAYSFPKWKTS
ncbi:MAG: hypothetical protein JNL57_08245 [Bacteroidetes bacterium]|nr:hypothetical protein [Bacteroidota bacterium]